MKYEFTVETLFYYYYKKKDICIQEGAEMRC